MKPFRLLILASGRGSNFEAIAEAVKNGAIPKASVVGLITNRATAGAVSIAKNRAIPCRVLEKSNFLGPDGKWDRASFELALEREIENFSPDWICLAGYLLLLGERIVGRWKGKVLNIHPSLLPHFKGLNAQKQALEAGEKRTGCTVHVVTPELDDGPILGQKSLEILASDTVESLTTRLRPLEHATYIEVLARLCGPQEAK